MSNLAIAYMQQRRFSAADGLLNQSVIHSSKLYGSESADYATSLINRADFYNQVERWTDAIRDAKAAIEILEKIQPTAASKANAYHRLGLAELRMNDVNQSIKGLENAKSLAEALGGSGRSALAGTLEDLARAYDLKGVDDKALQAYRNALNLNATLYGAESSAIAAVKFGLGAMYSARGNYDLAFRSFDEGNKIVIKRLLNDWSISGLDPSRNRYRPSGSEFGFTGAIQAFENAIANGNQENRFGEELV